MPKQQRWWIEGNTCNIIKSSACGGNTNFQFRGCTDTRIHLEAGHTPLPDILTFLSQASTPNVLAQNIIHRLGPVTLACLVWEYVRFLNECE